MVDLSGGHFGMRIATILRGNLVAKGGLDVLFGQNFDHWDQL